MFTSFPNIHSSGVNSHLVPDFNVTPTSAHVYSNWLAKPVSGCNNYGKQCFSDNLTAAIVVSDIQESLRHFFN